MEIIDPAVNYKRLAELADEFEQHWKRLQAFYLDAAAGFALVRGHVEAEQTKARGFVLGSELDSEEFQDTRQFSYAEIFADGFCTSNVHQATQGEVKARNAEAGANFTTLGQLCLTMFYDFWNDYLRREYVVAKGKLDPAEKNNDIVQAALREHASHDLWGDFYYLRSSIVHKQGTATSDVAKCKLIKWFKPGDPIAITPTHMRVLFMALLIFHHELFKEQFPESVIQL